MAYFHTSDIVTLSATITNVTRGGSFFATTPKDERIFINPQIGEALSLGIGDSVYAYSIDNFRDPEARHTARWRAIRVEVVQRLLPVVSAAPAPSPEAVEPVPAPAPVAEEPLRDRYMRLFQQNRSWTAAQIAEELKVEDRQKIHSHLNFDSEKGNIAVALVYASRSQKHASKVFYARDAEILCDLLDSYELE